MQINTFQEAEHRLINLIENVKMKFDLNYSYKYQGIKDPIAEYLGIKIIEKKLDHDYGVYLPATIEDIPSIIIDPQGSEEERLNFTYFHEITHHVIRSDDEIYNFIDQMATKNQDLVSLKEKLANLGAAEFLLPRRDVKEAINKNGFSIKVLPYLDEKYPLSKPAISIQLARHATHKCFVIVCEFGPISHEQLQQTYFIEEEKSTNRNCLYVKYSTSSPTNKYSISPYTVIPNNHLLSDIYKNKNSYGKGKDIIPFKNRTKWYVPCEGIFYKGKIYSAFNIDSPESATNLQPRLFEFTN